MKRNSKKTNSHINGQMIVPHETAIPDCLSKIKAYLRSLNVAEKKVAKYILENPEYVLNMTISELAAESALRLSGMLG